MLPDFVEHLQNEWKIGYSGIIGYMNALGHLLDFRRKFSNLASEIYLQRVKRFLSKKMKSQWDEVLSVDYLNSINCWATLADLQKSYSIPCKQVQIILLKVTNATWFIICNFIYCCCFVFDNEGIKTNDLQTLNSRDD